MDYVELKKIIDESGMKRSYIAKCLGMSDVTFHNRINGKSSWKIEEVQAFCDLFKISKLRRAHIFLP